jgi:hypothetical protein
MYHVASWRAESRVSLRLLWGVPTTPLGCPGSSRQGGKEGGCVSDVGGYGTADTDGHTDGHTDGDTDDGCTGNDDDCDDADVC